jgi:hypothetical protein
MLINENTIVRYPVKHNHVEIEGSPEVRNLIQQVYQQTKDDLLKPVTFIYQQYLNEKINQQLPFAVIFFAQWTPYPIIFNS